MIYVILCQILSLETIHNRETEYVLNDNGDNDNTKWCKLQFQNTKLMRIKNFSFANTYIHSLNIQRMILPGIPVSYSRIN